MIANQERNRIEKLLQKCQRLISTKKLLSILTLEQLIKLENCKISFKLVHDLLPIAISSCATTDHKGNSLIKKTVHRHNIRNKLVPNLPKILCPKYSQSLFCTGYKEYVKLSTQLKQSYSLEVFVKNCKKIIV